MAITDEQKKFVADRARHCCEYCKSQLKYSADSFSVEHILPKSRGGIDIESNLAIACQRCNNHKFTAVESLDPLTGGSFVLFHPRDERWDEHFAWSEDYLHMHGLAPTGRATVARLQLNRDGVVNLRRLLREVGEHPPSH